jgi:hypothetical protein
MREAEKILIQKIVAEVEGMGDYEAAHQHIQEAQEPYITAIRNLVNATDDVNRDPHDKKARERLDVAWCVANHIADCA